MLNNFDKLQLTIESQTSSTSFLRKSSTADTFYLLVIELLLGISIHFYVNCQLLIGYEIADSGRIGLPECGGRPLDRCRDFGIFFFTI